MQALRPHYVEEAVFVERVDEVQRAEGYRLVGVFEDEPEHALAVAGFRVGHMLMWGRFLYVDDLSTLPKARRRGYGRRLLEWLGEEAEQARLRAVPPRLGRGPDPHRRAPALLQHGPRDHLVPLRARALISSLRRGAPRPRARTQWRRPSARTRATSSAPRRPRRGDPRPRTPPPPAVAHAPPRAARRSLRRRLRPPSSPRRRTKRRPCAMGS